MKEEKAPEAYKYAIEMVLNEATILWTSSSAFLIANSILVAVIANILTIKSDDFLFRINPMLVLISVSIIGIIVCVLWLFNFNRRSDYYKFRAAQVKKFEPASWELFSGIGEKFTKGEVVHLNGLHYSFGHLSRIRPRILINSFIFVFFVIYVIALIISLLTLFQS